MVCPRGDVVSLFVFWLGLCAVVLWFVCCGFLPYNVLCVESVFVGVFVDFGSWIGFVSCFVCGFCNCVESGVLYVSTVFSCFLCSDSFSVSVFG